MSWDIVSCSHECETWACRASVAFSCGTPASLAEGFVEYDVRTDNREHRVEWVGAQHMREAEAAGGEPMVSAGLRWGTQVLLLLGLSQPQSARPCSKAKHQCSTAVLQCFRHCLKFKPSGLL
jgi:hypothetical protein